MKIHTDRSADVILSDVIIDRVEFHTVILTCNGGSLTLHKNVNVIIDWILNKRSGHWQRINDDDYEYEASQHLYVMY